jgi:hypothetical protein
MGFRFRRSISIIPGVRLNFGKSGITSLSFGGRGATVTVGNKGVYGNIGIPGSGLSYREKILDFDSDDSGDSDDPQYDDYSSYAEKLYEILSDIGTLEIDMQNDGRMIFSDAETKRLLEPKEINAIYKLKYKVIENWVDQMVNKINGNIEEKLNIHFNSPAPNSLKPQKFFNIENNEEYQKLYFQEPEKPVKEKIPELSFYFLKKIFFPDVIEKHEQRKNQAEENYQNALKEYNNFFNERKKFISSEKKKFLENFKTDKRFQEKIFGIILNEHLDSEKHGISTISYEMNGNEIYIDTDLPEIETISEKTAKPNSNYKRVIVKEKSLKRRREEYYRYVNGVIFLITSLVFAAFPDIETVKISGYTQVNDDSIGYSKNKYIISMIIDKNEFSKINFKNLKNVNSISALEKFVVKVNKTSTYILKEIEPI